ncbi:hypothetical protein BDV36DRAFT_302077 [Aspergillus pseudocaelatus]|uniref:Major facilitator superfamily (MFS) profile domain-containing protein n=1 Tax=Aspergillus pseudocaelatus TaxID=1825620 RepID=A0ABQ6W2D5_9EURO|nr:hypothetical protein BDV36DRAFT_302077 [Aspergillus pseudocaelatus]
MAAAGDSTTGPCSGLDISYGKPGYKGLVEQLFLLFLSLFASIRGVLFGYDQGVISGILVMNNFAKEFPTLANNSTLQGWLVSVLTLRAMFGALVNGPIADHLSRRWSILLANIIFLIGSIIQVASVNIPMIFISRFIAGLAIGQLSMVVPLYISELAPPNLRGGFVALQQFAITGGIMIAFWLNFGTQHIDREDEAMPTLSRVRRVPRSDNRIVQEMLEIKASAVFDDETTAAVFPGITSPIRINPIIYYAPQTFRKIGLSGSSVDLLTTGVIGILNFLCTIPAIMYMDRWGRRKVLLAGAAGMGISQLIVATLYAVYKSSWASKRSPGWATAVFVWLHVCNFAYSIGCVNWVIPSEIFPPGVRSQAVGIAIGTNWLSNFIVALITPRMLESIEFGTFYFYLAFCVFLAIWVYLFLPETNGVPIEEMDKIFGGSQGEQDAIRLANVYSPLGVGTGFDGKQEKDTDSHVENIEEP